MPPLDNRLTAAHKAIKNKISFNTLPANLIPKMMNITSTAPFNMVFNIGILPFL